MISRDQVQQVIDKWRAEMADGENVRFGSCCAQTYQQCADELASILALSETRKPSFQCEWDRHDPACAWRVSWGECRCNCAGHRGPVTEQSGSLGDGAD